MPLGMAKNFHLLIILKNQFGYTVREKKSIFMGEKNAPLFRYGERFKILFWKENFVNSVVFLFLKTNTNNEQVLFMHDVIFLESILSDYICFDEKFFFGPTLNKYAYVIRL